MTHHDVVIVGAGHGGAQCAIALRQNGFAGSIAMIGRESEPPYERPPLSKEYFAREKSFERLYIRPPPFWAEKAIDLLLGREVTALDPVAKVVTLSDGARHGYGTLVWAAGGDARRLVCPGADLAGVHAMRHREDCDRLMGEIDGGVRRVAVIGGGYIGLEAAAVLTKMGVAVTLLEMAPRVLSRVAGPELSAFYESEHRAHGVDLRTGVAVKALVGEGHVTGVMLEDLSVIPSDAVVVGVGITPSVGPLATMGAAGPHGVEVDPWCRTALPDVYAIGDCAAFACAYADGAVMRVESVQNANDQASCVALAICGKPVPYRALPWFWSNQYDLKLQTVGLSLGHDTTVLRGDPATRSFSVIYLKDGTVIALDCVNRVKDYVQGRKLVEARAAIEIDALSQADVPLKEMALRT